MWENTVLLTTKFAKKTTPQKFPLFSKTQFFAAALRAAAFFIVFLELSASPGEIFLQNFRKTSFFS